jgi:hypothetical protein
MSEEADQPDCDVPAGLSEYTGRRFRLDETEPRAMGLPLSWFGTLEPIDLRWLRHPYRWLRWRAEVRRRGPYAPRYEDFCSGKRAEEQRETRSS